MMKNYFKLVVLFFFAAFVSSCNKEELEPSLSAPTLDVWGVIDVSGTPQSIADGSIVVTPATESGYTITVKSNDWWNASIICQGEEWASIPASESSGGSTPTTITVAFTDNVEFSERTATLTFQTEPSYNGAMVKKTFTLVQTRASEYVVSNVTAEGLSLDFAADEFTTFLVSSNVGLTTSIVYPEGYAGEEWLSATPGTLPSGPNQEVTVTTTKLNGTGADRTAIVRLLTDGLTGDKDTCDIIVTQAFLVQSISLGDPDQVDPIVLAASDEIEDSVLVVSNVPFTAAFIDDATDAAPDWLSLSSASFEATTSEGVWVKFMTTTYNSNPDDRTATLTLETTGEYGDGGAKVSVTVGVKQVKFVQSLEFVNDPQTDPIEIAAISGEEDSVQVVSNVPFTVAAVDNATTLAPTWLSLPTASYAASPDGVWVKFVTTDLNNTASDRTAKLTLTSEAGWGPSTISIDVSVKQIKFVQTLKLAYDTQVDPVEMTGISGVKDSIKVVSNVPFTVAAVDDVTDVTPIWLSIPTTSYAASPDSVWVKFNTSSLNDTGSDRTATLTFAAEAGWGPTAATFDIGVKQVKFVQTLVFTNTSQDSVFLSSAANTEDSVEVMSNVAFSAAFEEDGGGTPSWLSLTTASFSASPNNVWVKFKTTSLNNTAGDRKAKLVLTTTEGGAPISIEVGVKQYVFAQELAFVNTPQDSVFLAVTSGSKDSVQVTSNMPFTAAFDGSPAWLTLPTTSFPASPDGVWVKFNTTSLNDTGDDRKTKLVLTGASGYGVTPPTIDVGVKQIGKLAAVAYATPTTSFNSDSLYVAWTGDPSYVSYKVVAVKNPSVSAATDTLVNVVVNAPSGATSSTRVHQVLNGIAALDAYTGLVDVKVIPRLTGMTWSTGATSAVTLHTKFTNDTGDGETATPIKIGFMRHLSNITSTLYDKDFLQVSNIDATWWMANKTFAAIGQKATPFTGVYDGGRYTISKLAFENVNYGSGSTGMFGHIKSNSAADSAVVKNLTVANSSLDISYYGSNKYDLMLGHALVVGTSEGGRVQNVHVTTPTITIEKGNVNVGGVVGVNIFLGTQAQAAAGTAPAYATVSYCSTSGGTVTQDGNSPYVNTYGFNAIGGVVGVNWNTKCLVEYSKNTGTTMSMNHNGTSAQASSLLGGVVGANDGYVDYCKNSGSVTTGGTNSYAGGVVGGLIAVSGTANQAFTTDADANHQYPKSLTTSYVRYSYNTGAVSATAGAYCIAGITGANNKEIRECYNAGPISSSGLSQYASGVGGRTTASAYVDCYNEGTVSSSGTGVSIILSGVSGWWISKSTVTRCYNVGQLSSTGTGGETGVKLMAAISVGQSKGGTLVNCVGLEGSSGPEVPGTDIPPYVGPVVSGYMYADGTVGTNVGVAPDGITAGGMKSNDDMTSVVFWQGEGYTDDAVWTLTPGQYPKLKKIVDAGI